MGMFKSNNGVVVQVDNTIKSLKEFKAKYPNESPVGWFRGDAVYGQLWDGKTLSNPIPSPASTNPQDYILTPRQFNHMAALAGYDDAIDAILKALKAGNRALYAEIKAGVVGSASFHFDKVEAIITNPAVAPLISKGVDVTKATLTANWLVAKDY